MSIQSFVLRAEQAYNSKDYEGALVSILSAVDATARLRYPDGTQSQEHKGRMGNSERFRTFLRDEYKSLLGLPRHTGQLAGVFIGGLGTIESVVYEHLRCCLLHETQTSEYVILASKGSFAYNLPDCLTFVFTFVGDNRHILLSYDIIPTLCSVVRQAQENVGEFQH